MMGQRLPYVTDSRREAASSLQAVGRHSAHTGSDTTAASATPCSVRNTPKPTIL